MTVPPRGGLAQHCSASGPAYSITRSRSRELLLLLPLANRGFYFSGSTSCRLAAGGLEAAFAYFVILLFCYCCLYSAFNVPLSMVVLFGSRESNFE